jgi:hypothetical protein
VIGDVVIDRAGVGGEPIQQIPHVRPHPTGLSR